MMLITEIHHGVRVTEWEEYSARIARFGGRITSVSATRFEWQDQDNNPPVLVATAFMVVVERTPDDD
jgi:hypothetical protein